MFFFTRDSVLSNATRAGIGFYEIAAGLFGFTFMVSGAALGTLQGPLLAGTILSLILIVAGILLMLRRESGYWLSIAMQGVQIFYFAILGTSWVYLQGVVAGFRITPVGGKLFVNLGSTVSLSWQAPGVEALLGFNFVPILLIITLYRLGRTTRGDSDGSISEVRTSGDTVHG